MAGMSCQPAKVLKHLMTKEKVDTAFERIKHNTSFAVDGYHLELINKARYDDMLNFMRNNFTSDEPMNKILNVKWEGGLHTLTFEGLQHELSIAMVSSETGEIIAGQINTIDNKYECFDKTACQSEVFRVVLDILGDHIDSLFDIYDHFNVEEAVHLLLFAVHKEHRHKGIGTKLIMATKEFLKCVDIGPKVLRAECTSNFSQRIFEKLGFSMFAEVIYADYKIDGKLIFESIGEHKSVKLYGMIV